MDAPYYEVIISAASATGAVLLSRGIDFFRAHRSESREDRKNELAIEKDQTQQALQVYKDLVIELKADTREMLVYMHKLETDHLSCREENAILRAEVKTLTERVASLEAQQKKS